MKSVTVIRTLVLIGALSVPEAALATSIAHLTLQSQPGDFIGLGGTYDRLYQSPPDTINVTIRRSLPDGRPSELLFFVAGQPIGNFALLFFGTDQLGIPIQPGTYTGAQRADFAAPGHPGLDVEFDGRGSNTLTGSFTILDVSFVLDPIAGLQVATFEANFEQHSEGAAPALFGQFRYDRSAAAVPEPATLWLCLSGASAVLYRKHRKTRTSPRA